METRQYLQCQSCGAAMEVAEQQRATACPYCLSPTIVERPPAPDRPLPRFAMGFTVPRDQARQAMRDWARGLWLSFRRGGLHKARVEEIRGLYVPTYLYSAVAWSDYQVEIGEEYTRRNAKGQSSTHTEWRRLQGRHAGYLADVLVSASQGIDNDLLDRVEPFDLGRLRRYQPELISGWIAEDPSRDQQASLVLARQEAETVLAAQLRSFMPGDEQRGLRFETRFEREALDLCLAPIWVFGVRYHRDRPPMQVLVNGQTGRTYGRAPLSWIKIGLAAALVLAVLAAVVYREPLLRLLGA